MISRAESAEWEGERGEGQKGVRRGIRGLGEKASQLRLFAQALRAGACSFT